jgi:hypothetical protein
MDPDTYYLEDMDGFEVFDLTQRDLVTFSEEVLQVVL